jgi:hypothetical protein
MLILPSSKLTYSFPPFLILIHHPYSLIHPLTIPPSHPSLLPSYSPDAPEAVETLASVHVDAIAQVTRVLRQPRDPTQTWPPPLPHESAFIVELVKKIYQWGTNVRTMEHLVNMVSTE